MMDTSSMNERITFISRGDYKPNDDGIGVATNVEEFSCWAEVAKMTNKDFLMSSYKKESGNIWYNKETPVFIIRFNQQKEVQSNWLVNWRNQLYEITSIDVDFKRKEMIQIATQLAEG